MKEDWIAKKCKEKEEESEQRDKRKKLKRDAEQDEAQEGQDQEEVAAKVRGSLKKEMPLKDIACPKCGSRQRTEQMRLVTKRASQLSCVRDAERCPRVIFGGADVNIDSRNAEFACITWITFRGMESMRI